MSLASFIEQCTSPPKATWSIDSIPPLDGQVMIVTGGNTGIGKETAKVLLQRNAKVYIVCRSRKKGEEAIKDIFDKTGRHAFLIEMDLASLQSIKAGVEEFLRHETQLHVLFNNAGVMDSPMDLLTADNYDLQFGVNCLAPFFLTKLLLPTLIATAKTRPTKKVRVINTSSWLHLRAKGIDFDTFKDGPRRKKMKPRPLYAQSKFVFTIYSHELARRYGGEGIVSISLHPGAVRSDLARHMDVPSMLQSVIMKYMAHPVPMGALTQLRAGTTPEAEEWNGKYLIPWARLGEPKKETKDPDLAKKLWDYLEEQVKDI